MATTFHRITLSPDQTRHLGQSLGRWLSTPVVIALNGDLGSGKTVFVQGLAAGLDVPEAYYVTSPSYTLVNEYPGRLPLVHVDLYRLEGGADIEDIGMVDLLDGGGVVAVEWAERLADNLPTRRLDVQMGIIDDHSRKISFTIYGLHGNNLIKSLEKSDKE